MRDLFEIAKHGTQEQFISQSQHNNNLNSLTDSDQNSLLHVAILHNNVEIFQLLIKWGVGLEAVNKDGQTPLHVAAQNGSQMAVGSLLNAKVKVNVFDRKHSSPLHYAVDRKDADIVEKVIHRDVIFAANQMGLRPIELALQHHNLPILGILVRHATQYFIEALNEASQLDTQLNTLLVTHDQELKQLENKLDKYQKENEALTQQQDISQEEIRKLREEITQLGSQIQQLQVVQALWQPISELEEVKKREQTQRKSTVSLINNNNILDSKIIGHEVPDVLSQKIETPRLSQLEQLILQAAEIGNYHNLLHLFQLTDVSWNINSRNAASETALCISVKRFRNIEIVKLLLDHDADPKLADSSGRTPIHWAIEKNQPEIIKLLIKKDKSLIDLTDGEGLTVIEQIIIKNRLDILNVLFELGVELDVNVVLHHAAKYANSDIVKFLLDKKANVNYKDSQGETALHKAVRTGDWSIIKLLIQKGADNDIANNDGDKATDLVEDSKFRDKINQCIGKQKRSKVTHTTIYMSPSESQLRQHLGEYFQYMLGEFTEKIKKELATPVDLQRQLLLQENTSIASQWENRISEYIKEQEKKIEQELTQIKQELVRNQLAPDSASNALEDYQLKEKVLLEQAALKTSEIIKVLYQTIVRTLSGRLASAMILSVEMISRAEGKADVLAKFAGSLAGDGTPIAGNTTGLVIETLGTAAKDAHQMKKYKLVASYFSNIMETVDLAELAARRFVQEVRPHIESCDLILVTSKPTKETELPLQSNKAYVQVNKEQLYYFDGDQGIYTLLKNVDMVAFDDEMQASAVARVLSPAELQTITTMIGHSTETAEHRKEMENAAKEISRCMYNFLKENYNDKFYNANLEERVALLLQHVSPILGKTKGLLKKKGAVFNRPISLGKTEDNVPNDKNNNNVASSPESNIDSFSFKNFMNGLRVRNSKIQALKKRIQTMDKLHVVFSIDKIDKKSFTVQLFGDDQKSILQVMEDLKRNIRGSELDLGLKESENQLVITAKTEKKAGAIKKLLEETLIESHKNTQSVQV